MRPDYGRYQFAIILFLIYADNTFLPFALLAERTFLPLAVFILARNP